jgi:hypothetical protein
VLEHRVERRPAESCQETNLGLGHSCCDGFRREVGDRRTLHEGLGSSTVSSGTVALEGFPEFVHDSSVKYLTIERKGRKVLSMPRTSWDWINPKASTHAVDAAYRTVSTTDGWDDVLNPSGPRIIETQGFLVRLCRGDRKARNDLKANVSGARFIGAEMAWFVPARSSDELAAWRRRWMPEAEARVA